MNFIRFFSFWVTPKKKITLANRLDHLIETESVYTYPNFSLALLEEMAGSNQKLINEVLNELYQQSFFELKRSKRINYLKHLIIKEGENKSLSYYVTCCGYSESESMFQDLKLETGLDFEDFCRYNINVFNQK
ncbi:MAG: hypothetical protein EA341_02770 [Mongoliibacter sp.]|uniref:hypothetical protein n=1 Tax=Mongoliibacter sp. TaxID=2022438 RepID=UPI0012F3E9F7|nr:hypothetical protein [Mongoliibacter sp.]TVP52666.1 MAG: hypothetical protein EA341_02770 [Mongoliibacter sp.]